MRELWRTICIVLLVGSLAYSKRKLHLRKHRFLTQRQDVEKDKPRKGFPGEKDRNISKIYDTVHKYSKKMHQTDSRKRHYLEQLSGVERTVADQHPGRATATVGVHPEGQNVGYVDAAHGVAAALNSQQLQIGTQAKPAHHPSDEGLNPLSMYHSRADSAISSVNAAFPADHHLDVMVGGHVGAESHVVDGRITDGLVGTKNVGVGGAADQTVVTSPDLDQEKEAFLQSQQGAINIVQDQGVSHINHIQDIGNMQHVDLGHHTAEPFPASQPEVLHHHMGNYFHDGIELEHRLAHQEPVVISHPPIHITKQHHHATYHDVEDQGAVVYHPCINGGVFVPTGPHSYECICPEQYIGKNCQDINHCHPCPCKNKGRCHNILELPKYKCTCPAGFYGDHCEQKDPCHPNPCQNNGKCSHDGKGKIECVCPIKFKGQKCEDLHSCKPNPCLNNGACIEVDNKGKFECQCTEQFRGAICNRPRFCYKNPCQNGGVCQEDHDNFNCICQHGWRGRVCEERACKPNPCKNGGTCSETADGKDFKCICLPWHSGRYCEENRPCLTKPCMNGGKCIDSFSGFRWSYGPLQFYCICNPPYIGERCEIHGCRNCHKNAHCEGNKCVCDDGYKGNGKICIKKADPCHPNPCENEGVCIQKGDTDEFECRCKKPYKQPYCKERDPCDPNPCKNEAQCVPAGGGSYNCICPAGFKGLDCSQQDACIPNPCQHGGTCRDENGTATCECKGFWAKPLCKECSCPKKSLPGVPDITCDAEGKCVCPQGYVMDPLMKICKTEKKGGGSPCLSNPCVNNGQCIEDSSGKYTCKCPTGFIGKDCQIKDPCNPNPCNNGGKCQGDAKTGKFIKCDCPPKFPVLPFCLPKEKPAGGACDPNPCKNGAKCVLNGQSYDCICLVRYTGPTCAIDKCANCDENAACINGRCKCKVGFIGNGYECIKEAPPTPTCAQKCPQYSTCVIPTGNCQCNPGYTFVDRVCLPIASGEDETSEKVEPTEKPNITPGPTTDQGGGSASASTNPTATPGSTLTPIPPTTAKPTTANPTTANKVTTAGPPAGTTTAPKPSPPAPPPPPPADGLGSSAGAAGPPGPPGSSSNGAAGPPKPPGSSSGSSKPPGTSGGSKGAPGSPGPPGSSAGSSKPPGASGGANKPPAPPGSSKPPGTSGGSKGTPGPPGAPGNTPVPPTKPPSTTGGSKGPPAPPGAPGSSTGSASPPSAPGSSKGAPGAPESSKGAGAPGPPGR